MLSLIISCGTLAGAVIPELIKVFTSTESAHVKEVVTSSREGGASLNVLSGLVAGNYSAYWMGIVLTALMGLAYYFSMMGLDELMLAPAVFAFGLVAFGFLGMGPVTIAVDSYGPVTDNAQSVFELSQITEIEGASAEIEKQHGFKVDFERAKELLEENDGAGNTFKATAKPVLIGTAVVGATTHDLLDRRAAHRGSDRERREAQYLARSLLARLDLGRRHHLLVHRCVHPSGRGRLLPGGRIHQEKHEDRQHGKGVDSKTARRSWRSAPATRSAAWSTFS